MNQMLPERQQDEAEVASIEPLAKGEAAHVLATRETWTPARLQSARMLTFRRLFVFALNLITMLALAYGVAQVFSTGGWQLSDIVIMGCFLVGAPWTVMGFWNAVLGLWLLHGRKLGAGDVDAMAAPHLKADLQDMPITSRSAILLFLRNEPPDDALARLARMRAALDASGEGVAFDFFVLSDSDMPDIAQSEEQVFASLSADLGGAVYRRRLQNTGWKAGNIRDWLEAHGARYDFFLPLDSDSDMSADAILRMVRIMQVHPKLGILQSLVVGVPARSAFARLFQFGMRHGMRSFTMGAAWWHGDCGPYWGHNALIRTAPFAKHCELPVLKGKPPLGGHVLSHDQIEAALMRRAGYEVRVLPYEGESWEENPPTLLDFTRRDLRWCQGNMQYFRMLGMKGLRPMSRFQVFAAIAMYFGAPAWMLMTLAASSKLFVADAGQIDFAFGLAMFFIMFALSLFPKIAGWLDVALSKGGCASYGGRLRFALGAVAETIFSILLGPVVALRVSIFMLGLLFGRAVGWSGQNRDPYALGLGDAVRGLWLQTVFGWSLAVAIWVQAPSALPWALPVLAGLCLSVPFALLTASPAFGRLLHRWKLCAVPEETPVKSPTK